jgi:hypothetical protein
MGTKFEEVERVPPTTDVEHIKTTVDSIGERLDEVVARQEFTEEIASATILEGDKTMKEYGAEIAKKTAKEVLKQIDKNEDGIIQPKEFISWGGEMLNGEGFKMLLITLLSITFDYIYSYLLTLFAVNEGGILTLIGKLIAFTIVTYGYKTVLGKVDRSKGDMATAIKLRDEEIEQHKQDKQANRLAIELLRHDNNNLSKENEELKKEVYRLRN